MRLPDRATRGSSCSINAQSTGGMAPEPGNWWRMANEAKEARLDIDKLDIQSGISMTSGSEQSIEVGIAQRSSDWGLIHVG